MTIRGANRFSSLMPWTCWLICCLQRLRALPIRLARPIGWLPGFHVRPMSIFWRSGTDVQPRRRFAQRRPARNSWARAFLSLRRQSLGAPASALCRCRCCMTHEPFACVVAQQRIFLLQTWWLRCWGGSWLSDSLLLDSLLLDLAVWASSAWYLLFLVADRQPLAGYLSQATDRPIDRSTDQIGMKRRYGEILS